MTRLLRAYLWCQVSRLGLWAIRKRMRTAIDSQNGPEMVSLSQKYRGLVAAHADHCEALQHARAGR